MDFVDEKYRLSTALDSPYAGKAFSKLPSEAQDAILTYPFICEVLQGISDKEVLEIFARLNQYSVPLNDQELRNGTYFGYFKQLAYRLAYDYVEVWRQFGLFSDQKIARMLEVEFTSELLVAQLEGMQDKKRTLSEYYEKYDQNFPNRDRIALRFKKTMEIITSAAGEIINDTPFRKPFMFYSLFCAIYHHIYGLEGEKLQTPKQMIEESEYSNITSAIATLADVIEQFAHEEIVEADDGDVQLTSRERRFAIATSRQTDNIEPRRVRMESIYRAAFQSA